MTSKTLLQRHNHNQTGIRVGLVRTRRSAYLSTALAVAGVATDTKAYTIQSPLTAGCHEQITAEALRRTRTALPGVVTPLASKGEDEALMADAPFDRPSGMDDIGAVSLLFGVRDNDMKDLAITDFDRLAVVTADPAGQREHCLRSPQHDDPGGSRAALEACRAFIRETLLSALHGVDERGRPDGNRRERLEVTLDIRGKMKVDVPIFYLRAGRALHALEDSFTHTFRRKDDPTKVTVVLNWIEYAEGAIEEASDGPPHSKELDRCDDPDELRRRRRALAVESATAALQALLDPQTDTAGKASAVDAVLDRYLSFAGDDCTRDNHWCNAPELAYADSGCGCRIGAAPAAERAWLSGFLMLSLFAHVRRRRRRSWADGSRSRRGLAAGAAAVLVVALPRGLQAEERKEKPAGLESPIAALEGRSDAGKHGKKDPVGAFFGRAAIGASYQKPGFSAGIGARYQMSEPWMFGFDAEWNPWVATNSGDLRAGTINAYASAIRRFQLERQSLNIRSTVALGAAVLLTDLVGAPAGSVGPYLGLSFLGVEWKWSPGFYLTVDPTYIAFPIPHVTGTPFGYFQYRFLVGVEFGG